MWLYGKIKEKFSINNHISFNHLSQIPNYESNQTKLYAKNDGKLYFLDNKGIETCLINDQLNDNSNNEINIFQYLNNDIATTNFDLNINGHINDTLKIKNDIAFKYLDNTPNSLENHSKIYAKNDGKIYLLNGDGIERCLSETNDDKELNSPWSINEDETDIYTSLNLGIGNTSPQTILHVTNNNINSNSSILRLETKSTSDSTTQFVEFYDSDTIQGKISGGNGDSVVFSTTSDKRLKNNIKETSINGSKIISKIKVKEFNWKKDNSKDIGFIAQELKEIYPEAVYGDESKEYLTIDKQSLIPIIIKSLQETIKINHDLKTKNDELNERLKQLEEKILN